MKFYEKSREFAQFYPQMEIIYKPLWTSDIHPLTPQSHLSQYDLSDDKRRGQPCVAVFILSGLISAQFTGAGGLDLLVCWLWSPHTSEAINMMYVLRLALGN